MSTPEDDHIAVSRTPTTARRAISHRVVDISDDNVDVSTQVLSQKEFLESKKTRFMAKEDFNNLKPHEIREHMNATTRPVDLEAKYGRKRARKMIKRHELKQHGKIDWNPRDKVADAGIKELDSDDIDINRRPRVEKFHFLNKSIYDMTEDEFYRSFFRDRDRRIDGMENKLQHLQTEILKEEQSSLSAAPRTRIAPRAYWFKPNYVSPTPEEVSGLNSLNLRFVMMNEARKAISTNEIDHALWDAFLMRVNSISANIVSKVQLVPNDHIKLLIDHIHRRKAEMKPKHYVFLFQALGRLRLRDQRLYDDLYEMVLCWSVLRNNFLVKAANALAKLGVCDSLLIQPLRQVLSKRLDLFSATDCLRLKAITVFDLFDDEMITLFLSKCEYHKKHFRHYSRNLELVELHLRLLRTQLYDKLDDATKQFLIDIRQQTLSKKLVDDNGTVTPMDTDKVEHLSDPHETVSGPLHSESVDGGQSKPIFHCTYHEDISRVLTHMGVYHRNYMVAGPFVLDIYEPRSNTVIEINTEYQYYHGTTHLTATATRVLHSSALCLAPKQKGKKDAGASQRVTAAQTDNPCDEHLFNIYAEIPEDHTMLPDEAYPKWLWDLDKPDKTYGELMKMFVYGHDIETTRMSDYKRFRRLHNRALIKLNNLRLQKQRKFQIKGSLWDN
ncbi:RAP domain-containing, putative [Babesia ovis]|uniref:Large ribosomal subunit protein mL54 n=1 Tax=Babesia ovis TaxID=5869 RepID=A0A9W5WUZ0_BABOV|nr:RAP domain-containing, putative [Babesia ovis]